MIEKTNEMPPKDAADKEASGGCRPSACCASLAQCSFCGQPIPIKKQRVFQKTAKHVFKTTGKMPTGPYCNVGCRSAYFSEIAAAEFTQIHSHNAIGEARREKTPNPHGG